VAASPRVCAVRSVSRRMANAAAAALLTTFMYAGPDREQLGPAMVPELRRLFETGHLSRETLVWMTGMPTWLPAGEVSLLQLHVFGNEAASDGASDPDANPGKRSSASSKDGTQTSNKHEPPEKKARKPRTGNITAVYITGVPDDADEEEVAQHFAKCGPLQVDPLSDQPYLKLYRDSDGKRKGDGLVVYVRREAMENAIVLLDEAPLRPGTKEPAVLHVERASKQPPMATMRTREDMSETMKRAVQVRRAQQEQAVSWNEEGLGTDPGLKIVVLKFMFDPTSNEVTADPAGFKRELEEDIREECAKFGEVKKVTVFEAHPDGVATVKFRATRSAEKCIETMKGRYFDGRVISAEFWDGSTDFRQPQTVRGGDAGEGLDRLDAFARSLEHGAGTNGR